MQGNCSHALCIKGLNRERRTLLVSDLAEPWASETSVWLELYYVVIWVWVREDPGSVSGKSESSNDAKRCCFLFKDNFLCCHYTCRWVYLQRNRFLISNIPENCTLYWNSLWTVYISIKLYQHFWTLHSHTTSQHFQSLGAACVHTCSSGMQLAKQQKGSADCSSLLYGNFWECLSLRTKDFWEYHNGTLGCVRIIGAHSAAMICHDAS